MSIDPRIDTAVSILLALLMGVGSGAIVSPPGLDASTWHTVSAWCAWILAIWSIVSAAFSSPRNGPLVPPAPPSAPK